VELALDESEDVLRLRACARAGIDPADVRGFRLARRSVDARRVGGRRRLRFVVHADLVTAGRPGGETFEAALRVGRVREAPVPGRVELDDARADRTRRRVVVVGAGPGGLFAAWTLAVHGVRVDLVDRGAGLRDRGRDLVRFHRTREPDPESNLLFGEGGAGTYSDGKLYTRVDDPLEIPCLELLVGCGAPDDILYDSRAHIGTDRLHRILPRLRELLESAGVHFHWRTRVDGLVVDPGTPSSVRGARAGGAVLPCDAIVVAPGHSARDTWAALHRDGVRFEAKPFQLGVRIEHPQSLIDRGRYGAGPEAAVLGPAYYNLTCRPGRGVAGAHSFCMCPGGRIVASVHVAGVLCTNGMSNARHSSPFANAAMVTTLGPREFGTGPFDGVRYQERLERTFFEAGGGDYTAPVQRADDFLAGRETVAPHRTSYTFGVVPGRIDCLLPDGVRDALRHALAVWDRAIPGFAGADGQLVGLESRSSGPVRMPRDRASRVADGFDNLYPVGEGAGYAGGIMSAALDGVHAAHAWLRSG
jgi:uncharacterized FAD-dependent dehydrogenase